MGFPCWGERLDEVGSGEGLDRAVGHAAGLAQFEVQRVAAGAHSVNRVAHQRRHGEFGRAPEIVQHATKLTRGVGALHRRSILHRDIKPANIHLGVDEELRILDLGVAISGQEPQDHTRDQAGTPSFIAPEQYTGAKPSEQMDLYAIGVTLYHTLTRKYPYGEIEPFQRPKFGEPVPPTRYRPDTPQWFENLILKAVARDPERRFETADELLLAIERGAARPLAPPAPTPLAQRDPATWWRAIAALSILLNIVLLYLYVAH